MPSPGEDIQSWSVTAVNNGTADPLIDWHEGQTRASVNNSARSEMAAHAKNRNLLNGSIVTTGSANAQQFLSGLTYTTVPTGLVVRLKVGPGLTSTTATTLNMDGIGDVAVKTADGSDLLGGEFVADSYVDLLYNGTNWIFLYSERFINDQLHGGGGIIIGQQKFSTPGTFTYTPTPGMECCIIECVGGGGGGGGGSGTDGCTYGGGGGGGAAYARKLATAADVGAALTVTVGAGGIAGNGTASGGQGGPTSVGSLCAAAGGNEGVTGHAGSGGFGGLGGQTGTGDFIATGGTGESGWYGNGTAISTVAYMASNAGGSSTLGGGGRTALITSVNNANNASGAPGFGGGGSGGIAHAGFVTAAGGAGGSGLVIITEFAGRGAPGAIGATGAVGPPGPAGAGTGDVLVFGTPAAGQIAQWNDTSHIQGVSTLASSLIQGTATNDSAGAGHIGEWLETSLSAGFGLSPSIWSAVNGLNLSAGDWEVWANVMFSASSTPEVLGAQIYPVANSADGSAASSTFIYAHTPTNYTAHVPPIRISLSAGTTYYINCFAESGGATAYAMLRARRMR
jgi:hypothetical protein